MRRCCAPQLLDENSSMIITILELQNQGKLQECSQCAPCALVMLRHSSVAHAAVARRLQARLQQNLMYLAAIADKTAAASAAAAAR